jgi:hypothetical protein
MSAASPGLTRRRFDALLRRLHDDRGEAGLHLERLRTRLEIFFAGNRCRWPDELADRALDILAEKIEEGESIESPHGYALGVARHLLMAERREESRAPVALEETHGAAPWTPELEAREENEAAPAARTECLRRCMRRVGGSALFIEYHRAGLSDEARRRASLARREQLSPGGLRKRVHTIRRSLEQCVRECEGRGQ